MGRDALREEVEATANKLRWLQHQLEHGTCAEVGHDWQSIGGCNCGCFADSACSVPVMQCLRCGDCDYGDSDEANNQRERCSTRAEHLEEESAGRSILDGGREK